MNVRSFLHVPGTDDDGFGILEAIIALTIIFMLIVTLLRTFDTTVTIVTQTGRRAAANALASELLERSRSLEWEHMGLTSNANGSDCPGDVGCATLPSSVADLIGTNAAGNFTFEGEEVVFANGATFDPFLSFSDQVTRGDVDYTRYLFVTSVRTDPDDVETETARRIVAVVRWLAPNGFPEEIRIATLVTEFTEPAQPFIHGEMDFDGGSVTVRGSTSRCGSDPECGAHAPGTAAWAGALSTRDDFTADLFLADSFVSATSDYVSGGIARYTGPSADVREAGVDAKIGTADDVVRSVEESQVLVVVDDDASSLPVRDEPFVAPVAPSPLFNASGTPPYDLLLADLGSSADLDLLVDPGLDAARVASEAWIEHDIDPSATVDDGLPYAALEADSAETTRLGFREYLEGASRLFYTALLEGSLTEPSYDFTLAQVGDAASGPAHGYTGDVDRFDDTVGNRQVHATATWAGEEITFLYDTLQPQEPSRNQFRGWVVIDLPTLQTLGTVQAGEVAGTTPDLNVSSELKVHFWNATTGKYVQAFVDYSGMTCDTSQIVSFSSFGPIGGPQTYTVTKAGHPQVRFEVDAEITIRKFCSVYDLDAASNVAGAFVQSQNMLSGTLEYKVTDELVEASTGNGVLFDLALDFDGGGLDATTLFYDPNA